MLVEKLKKIVADLFKQSEDAIPVIGGGDKKVWMACHLDGIIHEKGDALNCLLKFDQTSDVVGFLDKEYKERKEEDRDPSLPCEELLEKKVSGAAHLETKNHTKTVI